MSACLSWYMLKAGDLAPDYSTLPPLLPPGEVAAKATDPARAPQPPVLVTFFKISCPVCQFTFPFLERLYQGSKQVRVLAISQDDAEGTREFNEELGITLPMQLERRPWTVSNGFRVDHVPTMFLVGPDNRILDAETGFSRPFLEKIAALSGLAVEALFRPGERIPAYRPG